MAENKSKKAEKQAGAESKWRGRIRASMGFVIFCFWVSGAAWVAKTQFFPAFGWEQTGETAMTGFVWAFVALVLVSVMLRLRRPVQFTNISWSIAIPAGIALAIFLFWGLIELQETLELDQGKSTETAEQASSEIVAPLDEAPTVEKKQVAEEKISPEKKYPTVAYLLTLLLDRGWFQPVVLSCFSITLFGLFLKILRVHKESSVSRETVITKMEWPDNQFQVDGAKKLLEKVRDPKMCQLRETALGRRLERMLERVDNTKSTAGVDELMNSLSAIDADASSSSFGGVAFLIYLMPVIGFLGTIFGVGQAIYGFSLVIPEATDFSAIAPQLTGITRQLGVAFDTTLLALVLSALGGLTMTIVRQNEEKMLGEVDNDCVELFRSLTHEDPGTKQIVQAINKLSGSDHIKKAVTQLEEHMQNMGKMVHEAGDQFEPLQTSLETTSKTLSEISAALSKDTKATAKTAGEVQGIKEHMATKTTELIEEISQAAKTASDSLKETADRIGKDAGQHFAELDKGFQDQMNGHVEKLANMMKSESETLTKVVDRLEGTSEGVGKLNKSLADLQHLDAISTALRNFVEHGVRAELVSPDGGSQASEVKLPSKRSWRDRLRIRK